MEDIKALADSASNQSRAANRVLLAVLTVSFFALLGGQTPQSVAQPQEPLQMPLLGMKVPLSLFLSSSLVLLSMLMIAFTSAQMQAHLALRHAHRQIDKAKNQQENLRESFDRMVVGTLSRVAPIDQALAIEGLKSKVALSAIYVILKTVYWGVAIFFPLLAVCRCLSDIPAVPWYMWAVASVAGTLFIGLLIIELVWVIRRLKRSWQK